MRVRAAFGVCLAAASLFTRGVSAQPEPTPPAEPTAMPAPEAPPAPSAAAEPSRWARAEQNRIGLDFDYWPGHSGRGTGEVWAHALAWTVHAQIRVIEGLMLTAEVPWAAIAWTGDGGDANDSGGTFGNPTIGAHYAATVIDADPGVSFFVGGSLSIPTFPKLPDGSSDGEAAIKRYFAANGAIAALAYADMVRFFPFHMPLRLRGGVELRPVSFLYLRADLAPTWYIPTDSESGGFTDPEFVMDQGNEVELRADFGFGGGLRVQEVFTFTFPDKGQLALEPFVGFEAPDAGFFGRVGWLMALDKDLGFAFDDGKVSSLRMTFGGKF
jgi:hypothetical protein